MIKTITNLLTDLKKNGVDMISQAEYVKHSVMIGDMYEGLTSELLNKSIFEGLNLKVVSGKIKNNTGGISSQIDCMIVVGDGENLPFTNNYIYHYSQVIAVIEVKKNLSKNEILGSYSNLKSVMEVSRFPDQDGESFMLDLHKTAWESLTNTEYPSREDISNYTEDLQYIYHTLFMEAYFPLRIVFGFFGFKSEHSLRESFVNILNEKVENKENKGFGVGSFPNLIISEKYSLIKSNGMPYAVPFQDEEFYWPFYLSSNKNPIVHLLELLWTRLSFKYKISSDIFEDDLYKNFDHAFLNCKFMTNEYGMKGWAYSYFELTKDELSLNEPIEKWFPSEINQLEFVIINLLCHLEELDFDDSNLVECLNEHNTSLEDLLQSLSAKRLIFYNDKSLKLSTKKCITIMKGDKIYAGDDVNGMMSKFALENI